MLVTLGLSFLLFVASPSHPIGVHAAADESVEAHLLAAGSAQPNIRVPALEWLVAHAPVDASVLRPLMIGANDPENPHRVRRICGREVRRHAELARTAAIEALGESWRPELSTWLSELAKKSPPEVLLPLLPALCRGIEEYGLHGSGSVWTLERLGEQARPAIPVLWTTLERSENAQERLQALALLRALDGAPDRPARGLLAQFEVDQALFVAARAGILADVRTALAHGARVDTRYLEEGDPRVHWHKSTGKTPLMVATERGHVQIVRALLERGPDLEFRWHGVTALRRAVLNGSKAIEVALVDAGAHEDPDRIRAEEELIPATCADWERPAPIGIVICYVLAPPRLPAPNVTLDHVLAQGVDPDSAPEGGITALMYAANFGLENSVRTLLRHGADPNRATHGGRTAWSYAEGTRKAGVRRLLAEAGAKPPPPRPPRGTVLDRVSGSAFPLFQVLIQAQPTRVEIRDPEDVLLHTIEDPRNYTVRESCVLPAVGIVVAYELEVRSFTGPGGPGVGFAGTWTPGSIRKVTRESPLRSPHGVFQVFRADGTVEFQRRFGGDCFTVSPEGEIRISGARPEGR